MPLVSGVCRAASAPMLSHGGSRLNASKPEANPKTSCPHQKIFTHKMGAFSSCCEREPLFTLFRILLRHRNYSKQRTFLGSHAKKYFCTLQRTFSLRGNTTTSHSKTSKIESPLKQAWPSGCLVGAKYIKNSREFFTPTKENIEEKTTKRTLGRDPSFQKDNRDDGWVS